MGHELGYSEAETWHMIPYKIMELWKARNLCNGGKPKKKMDPIDEALEGF